MDDYNALGIDWGLVNINKQGGRVLNALRMKGLHEAPEKTVTASPDQKRIKFLGTEVSDGRVFGPDRDGLRRLIHLTRAMLSAEWVAGDYVRLVQGHWTCVA